MRDRTDRAMPEMGDLPPYQYKNTERDNAGKRAAAIGYQGPKERARCETCANCTTYVHSREFHRCQLAAIDVQRGGICPKHRERSL